MKNNQVKQKEIVLLSITGFFAAYNLYEIYLVKYDHGSNAINGFLDLIFPVIFIFNLVWAIKSHSKAAYICLLLSAISIVGVVVLLAYLSGQVNQPF